jgi:predicted Zn-dependent protease
MKLPAKKLLILLTLLTVPTVAQATYLTQRVSANGTSITATPTDNSAAANKQFYQTAREDMEGALGSIGKDYYVVYRIVERLARANGLDERPWRIRISPDLEVNASASNLNLLTFESGLLEQLEGDRDALACVVGHEMAHHTQKHIPSMVAKQQQLENLQKAALIEARQEVEAANRRGGLFGSLINIATNIIGTAVSRSSSWGGWLTGSVANQTLNGLNQEQTQQAMAKAEEIYKKRAAALDAKYAAELQKQESEADRVGYEYIVRAGFAPQGCNRTMALLSQTETSMLPSISHPKPSDRLANLKTLNTTATNQKLTTEGEANLSRSAKALKYDLARDGASIRIESRFGAQDVDSGFPD